MSSVSSSSALSDLIEEEEAEQQQSNDDNPKTTARIVPSGRRGHDAFGSLIDDWYVFFSVALIVWSVCSIGDV